MASRRCPGRYCPTILVNGERYCPTHEAEYEAKRGTSKQRGYNGAHVKLRASWQARIDAGEIIHCARCGKRVAGRAWDLGHNGDRTGYNGPECIACNRSAGGKAGRAAQAI